VAEEGVGIEGRAAVQGQDPAVAEVDDHPGALLLAEGVGHGLLQAGVEGQEHAPAGARLLQAVQLDLAAKVVDEDPPLAVAALQLFVEGRLEAAAADDLAELEPPGLLEHGLRSDLADVAEYVAGELVAEVDPAGRHLDAEEREPRPLPLRHRQPGLIEVVLQHQRPVAAGGADRGQPPAQQLGFDLEGTGELVDGLVALRHVLALHHQVEGLAVLNEVVAVAVEDNAALGRGGADLDRLLKGQLPEFAPPHQLQPAVDRGQQQDEDPGGDLQGADAVPKQAALTDLEAHFG
jgi:hypothetical protein